MAKIDLEGVAGASSSDSWEGFTKNFQENIFGENSKVENTL